MNFPKQLDKLKKLPQWVAYRLVWNEKKGKSDKRPINPHDGTGAKANDPATWGTYDEAMNYAERAGLIAGKSGGIGFEFGNGYCGIDLDNVILEDGSLKPFASEIVKVMNSYTEYSPSGKGLHVLCKLSSSMSDFGERHRNDEIGLEMYDSGRFFTVTGEIYGEEREISERTAEARKIYDKYLFKGVAKNSNTPPLRTSNEFFNSGLTDNELWKKMFNSQHGREILLLSQGDLSGYGGDHSRADLALCSHLAYWTNCDALRMDRMFRQSGLMREKWDERHGAQTYGAMTLNLALRTVTPYIPPVYSNQDSFLGLADFSEVSSVRFVGEYLMQKFKSDIDRFSGYRYRKTGYSNLDEKMSLYPGLYVLGAVSSLGKTTFVGQLADQLSEAGDHVLYFSLEQSEFELVSKGISRMTARENLS